MNAGRAQSRAVSAVSMVAALAVAPSLVARATSIGRVHAVRSQAFHPADAALVLGARVWPDGRPSLFLRQRVEVGVHLYRRGLVSRVVVSGSGHNREGLDETAVMARVVEEAGVPFDAIDIDAHGHDTYTSALRARDVLGLSSVIVASQEFHLPRAVWLCRQVGLEAQGAYPPVLLREHTALGYVREVPATFKAMAEAWADSEPLTRVAEWIRPQSRA